MLDGIITKLYVYKKQLAHVCELCNLPHPLQFTTYLGAQTHRAGERLRDTVVLVYKQRQHTYAMGERKA